MKTEEIKKLEENYIQKYKDSSFGELKKLQITVAWSVFDYLEHMSLTNANLDKRFIFYAEMVMYDAVERFNAELRAINRILYDRELKQQDDAESCKKNN